VYVYSNHDHQRVIRFLHLLSPPIPTLLYDDDLRVEAEDEDDTTVRDFHLDGAVLDDFRHVRKLVVDAVDVRKVVVDAVDVGERKEVCADGQELKKRRDGPGERLKTERHGPPPGRPLSLRRRRRRALSRHALVVARR